MNEGKRERKMQCFSSRFGLFALNFATFFTTLSVSRSLLLHARYDEVLVFVAVSVVGNFILFLFFA